MLLFYPQLKLKLYFSKVILNSSSPGFDYFSQFSEECLLLLLLLLLSYPTLSYESFKLEKAANSRDDPVLCLQKNQRTNLYCTSRHFVTSSLPQKHITCSTVANLIYFKNAKDRPD